MTCLKKIIIQNYRSIEYLEIIIPQSDSNTNCFGLVGINEAGKSSILKAIALKDNINTIIVNPNDFRTESNPISVEYKYELENVTLELREIVGESISEKDVSKLKSFSALYSIEYGNINFVIEEFLFDRTKIDEATNTEIIAKLNVYYKSKIHDTVFWAADEKHLINKPIPLNTFLNNPQSVSIPLYNCFQLASIRDIPTSITKALSDPTERDYLEDRLGIAVTKHVKETWKNELIEIKLKIYENLLHFLIKDLETSSKSKTVDQRSDGFKQFISFLLTVSAESKKGVLQNTILLIDEPETHLHPIAQGNLLDELTKISGSELENISFFATHSNYLISKNNLGNYFHITKKGDHTNIERFNLKQTNYAEVNYIVFDIVSTDFHDILYGKILSEFDGKSYELDAYIKENFKNKKNSEKDYIKQNSNGTTNKPTKVSLQTYIRHLIHHPENLNNNPFSEDELRYSIEVMIQAWSVLNKY
jgi:predicted ATP-dependent endonuclease of OLD family